MFLFTLIQIIFASRPTFIELENKLEPKKLTIKVEDILNDSKNIFLATFVAKNKNQIDVEHLMDRIQLDSETDIEEAKNSVSYIEIDLNKYSESTVFRLKTNLNGDYKFWNLCLSNRQSYKKDIFYDEKYVGKIIVEFNKENY